MISLLLIVGIYIVIYVLWVHIIIPSFLSPLSKIPKAHFTSSFSPLWILWKRYAEQENRAIYNAHLKHGEIVRLGPNEISVNCVDGGIRTVYSGGFEKWAWYPNQFENYGVPNMFSMARSKPHSNRKRMISNVYSKSYLQSSPDMHKISDFMIFKRLLPLLDKFAVSREPVDVLELNFASTMDFIMAYIFGLGNGTNFIEDTKSRQTWLRVYRSRRPFRFWDGELPTLKMLSAKLGFPIVPKWVAGASRELEAWTLKHCKAAEEAEAALKSDNPPRLSTNPDTTPPIVHQQLSAAIHADETPTLHPKLLQIATELHDHLAAGHETSGITLTYLMHELSLNPALQAALRTELLTLPDPLKYPPPSPSSSTTTPPPRTLDTLPLLHACLMETLRLHAAIPGPQPRTTPFPPATLANSPPLPPGVRVSAQPYSLHRNPAVFPDPEVWKPARWLDPSLSSTFPTTDDSFPPASSTKPDSKPDTTNSNSVDELTRWFWAFGSGGRMCVGSHFAVQEMKLIAAAVYTNFVTSVVDDVGVEQVDAYTAGPRAGRLILRFRRAE